MKSPKFGKINVVLGERNGKFPFDNSVYIDDSIKVIIDPGAGLNQLIRLKDKIDLVINSHYHFDHIAFNYLFRNAQILINEKEKECFENRYEIPRRTGLIKIYGEEWVEGWIERTSRTDSPQSPYTPQNRHEWSLSSVHVNGTYEWGEVFDFGATKMKVIGAPGHTEGHSCYYFPDYGVVYSSDIDLTSFGPWVGGLDSDIDMFIESAKKIAKLNADWYITSHEMGIVPGKVFKSKVHNYIGIIEQRENKILKALHYSSLSLIEMAKMGLMYEKKYHADEWVWAWEILMINKYLERLVSKKIVKKNDDNQYYLV